MSRFTRVEYDDGSLRAYLAPPCKSCNLRIHDAPYRIESRSANNAKHINRWVFCTPGCLTSFVSTSEEWKENLASYDELLGGDQ